ncbi:MAG: hypothetical protein LBV63_01900 [Candidatus Methanoplasma sp.]|jgi:hypothetical protein|nr:hypothetical protein [Candidatus Methanoplasma sp.]
MRITSAALAITTVVVSISAFVICIRAYNDGLDRNDLILYSSILASVLTLAVLIVACVVVSDPGSPSDAYRKKYRSERAPDDLPMEDKEEE